MIFFNIKSKPKWCYQKGCCKSPWIYKYLYPLIFFPASIYFTVGFNYEYKLDTISFHIQLLIIGSTSVLTHSHTHTHARTKHTSTHKNIKTSLLFIPLSYFRSLITLHVEVVIILTILWWSSPKYQVKITVLGQPCLSQVNQQKQSEIHPRNARIGRHLYCMMSYFI